MFQTKFVEKITTYILCWTTFSENRAVYEIMSKNMVEPERPNTIIWRTRIARWIKMATNTDSVYVRILALPQKSSSRYRASTLRCTFVTLPVFLRHRNRSFLSGPQPTIFTHISIQFVLQEQSAFLSTLWKLLLDCISVLQTCITGLKFGSNLMITA